MAAVCPDNSEFPPFPLVSGKAVPDEFPPSTLVFAKFVPEELPPSPLVLAKEAVTEEFPLPPFVLGAAVSEELPPPPPFVLGAAVSEELLPPPPFVVAEAVAVNKNSHSSFEFEEFSWETLYEILDMKILRVDTKDSVEVYGKIILHTSNGFVFLLNREKSDPETVNLPGGAITLTNPNIGVNGLDRVGISFDLGGDLEELNEEFLGWEADDVPNNTLLTAEIEGGNCSMAVRCIIFSHALVANVEIKLLKGEEEEQEEEEEAICGNITASFSEMAGLEFNLFNKKRDDCVAIGGGELIPLSKSVIAVPCGSAFDIRVDLPVAAGTVRFYPECCAPKCCGEYVGIISDKIEVKVTFWVWRHHPPTKEAINEAMSNFKCYFPYYDDQMEEEKSAYLD